MARTRKAGQSTARSTQRPILQQLRSAIGWLFLLGCTGLAVTAAAAVLEPLPEVLVEREYASGLIVLDSERRTLGQVRPKEVQLAVPVAIREVPKQVTDALIAAEDRRFYGHRGFDPLAMIRATGQLLSARRIVSGASTITQQLARSVSPRPRTFYGKWRELVVSLRIEAALSKSEVLEAYLNRVPFGTSTRGIAAAAEDYFDKPLSALSLAETAALAALPKGPTYYHPRRHGERLLERRNRILRRMQALDVIDADAAERAQKEPVRLRDAAKRSRAPHLLHSIALGRFDARHPELSRAAKVETTLDSELQTEVESLVNGAKERLREIGATAAAVVVLDNADPSLRAYVGSIDFFDVQALGQNDGCMALRQPGSALKPFVYAAGIEWTGLGPTSLLLDVETEFGTSNGVFSPKNYDGRYHGVVLLRDALGSSLNVPAVAVAERVGVERLLALLRNWGFQSLTNDAAHYGLALALGDGEVRLLELAQAYSTLARLGAYRPLRIATHVVDRRGNRLALDQGAEARLISEITASQILEILSDDQARAQSFGRHGILDMPHDVAAKTGTSSNHRDNWAVAVTHEITAAVWVGNFDGQSLVQGASGVVGAGPLLRSVVAAAMRRRPSSPLFPRETLAVRRVCKLSGQSPGRDCPETVQVRLGAAKNLGICSMHRRIRVDPSNGLLAGDGCRDAVERVVETYPARAEAWASAAGRPVAPTAVSPRCPFVQVRGDAASVELTSPLPGARFVLDPHLPPAQQMLTMRVHATDPGAWVEYVVDGESSGPVEPPFSWRWLLRRGVHRVTVTAASGARDEASFVVE